MIFLMAIESVEDRREFVILYEKYRFLMMKIAVDVLHDPQLAEDAVHNAFLNAAKHMDRIQAMTVIGKKRYLITAAKHAAIDIYRRRHRQMEQEILVDEWTEEMQVTDITDGTDERESRIMEVLMGLPVKYRDVFSLKYTSGLNNREIARLLGIKEGTVRQRLARGRQLIEQALE